MDEGFLALVRECYRLTRVLPWRTDTGVDWDEVKYALMKSAAIGHTTCELKYDVRIEKELARVGFVVATRPADEQRKLCKALIVSW